MSVSVRLGTRTGNTDLKSGRGAHVCRGRVALPTLQAVDVAHTGTGHEQQLAATLPDLGRTDTDTNYSGMAGESICHRQAVELNGVHKKKKLTCI